MVNSVVLADSLVFGSVCGYAWYVVVLCVCGGLYCVLLVGMLFLVLGIVCYLCFSYCFGG